MEEMGVQHPGGVMAAKRCIGFRRMCVRRTEKLSPEILERASPGIFYEESSGMTVRLHWIVPARDDGQPSGCSRRFARTDSPQPRQVHRRRRPES